MNFCVLETFIKEKHLNVIKFFIGHFSKKNYA